MGGCQINNPCFKEIKGNENYPIIVNNTINNSEMNKDEPKVSNEEINIALPVSPLIKNHIHFHGHKALFNISLIYNNISIQKNPYIL